MNKCYYSILNVSKNATSIEIKKSYRKLVIKYHPDRNGDTEFFNEKIKELNEAYECLSNAKKKAIYDEKNSYKEPESFRFTKRTPEAFYSVEITLEESFFGCKKQIFVINKQGDQIPYLVEIPRGVDHDWILTVPGNYQVQEFYIKIKITHHNHFTREGQDLFCNVTIPYIYTLMGGSVDMYWFDGKRKLHVNPGIYSGATITLPGLGMPYPNSSEAGNLHVTVSIRGLVDLNSVLQESVYV